MRGLRLLAPTDPEHGFPVLYHITSRVVEKRFIFGDRERARFLKLAKDFAAFSGFELVSWCLMSNHFHLLVRVPVQDVEALSDEEMIGRLRHILSAKRLDNVAARLDASPTAEMRRDVLDGFRKRIGHLPSFVKAVKQEFTQWFNFTTKREGTLWESRYHSTLIEDTGGEMATESGVGEIARIVARYIDMNPVRAKVEADPKDSAWSSYGAALRGDQVALHGLSLLWGRRDDTGSAPSLGDEATGEKSAKSESPQPGDPYLETHRRWLLAAAMAADPDTRADAPDREQSRRPRGRPPALTSLSRIRVLGSRAFLSAHLSSGVSGRASGMKTSAS